MNAVCRLDRTTRKLFKYVDDMIDANYTIDHRKCMKMAVDKIVSVKELQEIYTFNDITYDEYIEDMAKAYLRYKTQMISEAWKEFAEK